jgi:cytosine/adenosine deaminase-related metal-dependent hydrolase
LGIDGFRAEAFTVGRRPLAYLQRLAAAPKTLVIHGNYLGDEEIALLAARRDVFSVVYCPRTHAYFGHAPYPLPQLLAAGVNVALGTDSRASSPDLSLLAEMREAAARHSNVPPEAIVRMATLGGAAALDLADSHGSLAPGKRAEMIAVALPERGDGSPYALLLAGEGRVVAPPRAQPSS